MKLTKTMNEKPPLIKIEAPFATDANLESANDEEEEEIPDIFDLRPLATQRITVKIREIKHAVFHYIPD